MRYANFNITVTKKIENRPNAASRGRQSGVHAVEITHNYVKKGNRLTQEFVGHPRVRRAFKSQAGVQESGGCPRVRRAFKSQAGVQESGGHPRVRRVS